MIINSAEFVISNVDYKLCPTSTLPEYGFIGRSNVGKSSLINMLVSKKDLAKTSSKPGKTLLINHFIINEQWHLVDLPGYGYARASKLMRDKLKGIIEGYVLFRPQLTNLFVLLDSRLTPQQIDLEFMEWLGEQEVPFSIVFTKGDKQSTSQLNANVMAYKKKLIETWEELPPIFVTSAEKGFGKDDILNYIESINQEIGDETLGEEEKSGEG